MWDKFNQFLKANRIATDGLSPNLLNNNELIIPHLIGQIGEDVVVAALSSFGVCIFNDSHRNNVCYTNDSFVLVREQTGSDSTVVAFCKNPYSSLSIFQANNKAREKNLGKITQFGFISSSDNLFNKNKTKPAKSWTDNTAQKLITDILMRANENDVSDIHISPRNSENIAILFRQFGEVVESGFDDVLIDNYQQFANSLIVIAGGNGGNYNRYLEKQFTYKNSGVDIAVRLQQNPTIYKFSDGKLVPSFVLRIHNNRAKHSFKLIDEIGFLPEHIKTLKTAARQNSGVIVVAGPTGSGKTTALYAILAEGMSRRKRLVQTIEDPVEITVPSIEQTNINKKADITYENAINAILRSDIDIALIGEIRSAETANGVIELDRVGHLVLATIHTKKTTSIIDRLQEFGIKNTHIADALSVIISTRLVKKVCPNCSTTSTTVSELHEHECENGELLKKLKIVKGSRYIGHNGIQSTDQLAIIQERGCAYCVGGYSGRVLVAEVCEIDNTIHNLISLGTDNSEIQNQIQNKNIWQHGFELVRQRVTTLDALELVLPKW